VITYVGDIVSFLHASGRSTFAKQVAVVIAKVADRRTKIKENICQPKGHHRHSLQTNQKQFVPVSTFDDGRVLAHRVCAATKHLYISASLTALASASAAIMAGCNTCVPECYSDGMIRVSTASKHTRALAISRATNGYRHTRCHHRSLISGTTHHITTSHLYRSNQKRRQRLPATKLRDTQHVY
jgi:hypothetical protein